MPGRQDTPLRLIDATDGSARALAHNVLAQAGVTTSYNSTQFLLRIETGRLALTAGTLFVIDEGSTMPMEWSPDYGQHPPCDPGAPPASNPTTSDVPACGVISQSGRGSVNQVMPTGVAPGGGGDPLVDRQR
jgi:hypothetical protein